MLTIVTGEEMRELERQAIAEVGIPSLVLMENAGVETVREILQAYPDVLRTRVLVLCGRGNNGGDGFVIARRLRDRGVAVETFLVARREEVRGDARVNLEILERLGAPPIPLLGEADLRLLEERLRAAALVVDALLGTGARGAATDLLAQVIALVNAAARPVVAVDIPSGLGADLAEPPGPAVRAAMTVTFAFPKRSLLLYPAAEYAGVVRVADIGIPLALGRQDRLRLHLLEASDAAPAFPRRAPEAHKGTFGHVLVIAGSVGKTGAASLCALAAQRVGAGLVTLAAPASLNDVLEVKLTEVMTAPVAETEARSLSEAGLDRLLELTQGKSAVALGPGLGTHPSTQALVRQLLARVQVPVVLDADGINALAGQPELLRGAACPLVLTPHPRELARLLGCARDRVLADRIPLLQETATGCRLTLILKLARTLIADAQGGVTMVPTGNPGMATGGTGDVLTGLIAGLIAQGVPPTLAAWAGTYVHGLAGDLAAGRLGQEAMLAGDLLEALPEAIRQVKASAGRPAIGPPGN
jgi:hydroxyethylthiazole kinase-like uncharacterized protein yjeF